MTEGCRWLVDIDVEKVFDQVNHDMRMSRVARKIKDKRLLKLSRRYLSAGIMSGEVIRVRQAGTAQGAPLSPLLSNGLWDDVDKERERRGHHFCRYADDANSYGKSRRAGERVRAALTHCLAGRLRRRVKRAKSAGDRPWNRGLRGYTVTTHHLPRRTPAPVSGNRAQERIRQITPQGRGRNIRQVIEINEFTRGWVGYVRLASGKAAVEPLDQWLRRRLRNSLWEQWRKPKTRRRKLMALGVDATRACKAAATGLGAWWNAGASHMHAAVTIRLLTQWGRRGLLDQLRGWQQST